MLVSHPAGTEPGAEEDVEEQRRVPLGLLGDLVFALHDDQPLGEVPDTWAEVGVARE